jgi:predicted Rossmann-fold nucleotide-binding protein
MAPRLQRRVVQISTLVEFDAVAAECTSMEGWRVRRLDLTARTAQLLRLDPAGSLLLGCRLEPAALVHLEAGGALVYPEVPGVPVDQYRSALYTPDELYTGLAASGYSGTPDATIYAWSQRPSGDSADIVVRALHDASMESALDSVIADIGRQVVGVMGGHAIERGSAEYHEAATLGRLLERRGFLVATGGGPGAMEAANLGAHLAGETATAQEEAERMLSEVPAFRPSIMRWAEPAMAVRSRWPGGAPSLGVPTWFYGHEPSNAFATHIAKFFQNSLREATLLNRCTGGIVFLPGAAGTVQEIFQDACENYYADAAQVAPMVLVGVRHWTDTVPAWPLLSALARDRGFAAATALVDRVDEAADVIGAHHGAPADTARG